MLCFRCGSYNVDDAAACSVCGQGFTDAKSREARAGKKASDKAALGVFAPGEVVGGKYRVIEVIGQGGVGAVYKARDVEIDVDVALKAISPNLLQTEEEQRLFSRMMKQARKLHHANIIRIYDEGAEGQRRYITMKLLEGLTLRKIIRLRHDKGQSFSPEEIVPIFHQLASAFDYAHKTTWHGDLKPENVIILPDLLKVTDFNLVKGLPLKPFLGIAKSRSKGFPYIAPELRVESTQVDGRVDIYSMGVILAEMLTGLVYEGHFTRAMTAALEQLPTKLDGLVRRSLSEHPDGRFPKAGDMASELEVALEKLPKAALPAPAGKAPKKRRATPPPPPAETNPGVVPPGTDEQSDDLQEDPSLEEIGQSQVLLLDESPPTESSERSTIDGGDIAPGAAKRRDERAADVVKGMKPPPLDGVDGDEHGDGDGDDDVRPAEVASRKPPLPDDRVGDRGEDGLIPPPLPENADLDASDSYDIPAGVSVRGVGSREQGRPPRRLRDDGEEEETLPDLEEVGIHEELTALKPQPRPAPVSVPPTLAVPQLADDDVPSDVETVTRAARSSADRSASSEEEEPPAMASAAELALAKERSSPRLHAAQPIAPPVVATQASGIHSLPPGLRPVAPPERKKSGGGMWIGAAAVAVVILFGVVVMSGGDKNDGEPAESALATGPMDDEKPGDATADTAVGDAKTAPAEAAVVAEASPSNGDDNETAASDEAAAAAAEEKAKAEAAELARLAKLEEEEERRRQEEAERRRAEEDKKRPDDKKVASAEDSRREAERAAAAAREKAEAEEKRRLDEERRREQEKRAQQKKEAPKLAAVAADPTKVKCPAGMQLIPAGSFTMGSTPSDPMRNFGENLATKTDVAAYCIDYYEFPNSSSRPPTTNVSWTQAKNACASKGRRLCTEAEWERGCKGPGNKRFAYGNTYDADKCNTEDPNGGARTVKGARDFKKCRSGFGVYATSGNAEEWVADSFRAGAASKVAKGGSVDRPDWASRCAARRGVASSSKTATLGFRCCADPQ